MIESQQIQIPGICAKGMCSTRHPSFLIVLCQGDGRFVLRDGFLLACNPPSSRMRAAERQGRPPDSEERSEKPEALILGVMFSEIRSHVFIFLNNPSQLLCLFCSFKRKIRSTLIIGKYCTCEYRRSQGLYLVCSEYIS